MNAALFVSIRLIKQAHHTNPQKKATFGEDAPKTGASLPVLNPVLFKKKFFVTFMNLSWFPISTQYKKTGPEEARFLTRHKRAVYCALALASDRVAPTRAARAAAINASRSPSSTALGFPVSTLVRRSFTI